MLLCKGWFWLHQFHTVHVLVHFTRFQLRGGTLGCRKQRYFARSRSGDERGCSNSNAIERQWIVKSKGMIAHCFWTCNLWCILSFAPPIQHMLSSRSQLQQGRKNDTEKLISNVRPDLAGFRARATMTATIAQAKRFFSPRQWVGSTKKKLFRARRGLTQTSWRFHYDLTMMNCATHGNRNTWLLDQQP